MAIMLSFMVAGVSTMVNQRVPLDIWPGLKCHDHDPADRSCASSVQTRLRHHGEIDLMGPIRVLQDHCCRVLIKLIGLPVALNDSGLWCSVIRPDVPATTCSTVQ